VPAPTNQKFFVPKANQAYTVLMKFDASPRPSEATWKMADGSITLAAGAVSLDENLVASKIEDGVSEF